MNVGAIGAPGLLMIAGDIGGSHRLTSTTPPPAVPREVHTLIEWTIFPFAAFILTNALGELLGGLG